MLASMMKRKVSSWWSIPSVLQRKKKRAFTLIEILVSIGIISVLAGVTIQALAPRKNILAATDSARIQHARQIERALYQYLIQNLVYPNDASILEGEGNAVRICAQGIASGTDGCLSLDSLIPEQIAAMPRDAVEPCTSLSGFKVYKASGRPAVIPTHLGKLPGDSVETNCAGLACTPDPNTFGDTFVTIPIFLYWKGIAMSDDGSIQAAVAQNDLIYVSTDYGVTWNGKGASRNWNDIAVSSNGQYQTAIDKGGSIYVSTDAGETWTAKDSDRDWTQVAMSGNGQYQTVIVDGGYVYVSADYGNTWTQKDALRSWIAVAMSSDGAIQTASSYDGILVSTDYGNTWTVKDPDVYAWGIDMSSDGVIQTAGVWYGYIYVSSDSGTTWTQKHISRSWEGLGMSADGVVQVAADHRPGYLHYSIDSGNTWTPKATVESWWDVAVSADGSIQTAVELGGYIYVSNACAE